MAIKGGRCTRDCPLRCKLELAPAFNDPMLLFVEELSPFVGDVDEISREKRIESRT